jgi:hypothetical protein
MPRLRAEETAAMIDAISFPHLEKRAKESFSRKLRRRMQQGEVVERPKSPDEMRQQAGRAGIAVIPKSKAKAKSDA